MSASAQFVIVCEPGGLRIQLRQDRSPNQDFGVLLPSTAIGLVQRYCNTLLGLPNGTPFTSTEIGGIKVYYSQTAEALIRVPPPLTPSPPAQCPCPSAPR